ncbi:MAG TPA: hypothetical protein PKK33_09335, partial [Candidatus Cloacimonadota bacterium]|nr:hypothetical protein [Candidatus Cloacimonadota bacterium]
LDYYDVHPNLDETDSSFTARRDSYLQKCDQLAGNADLFLKLFKVNVEMDHPEARRDLLCKMIEDWDVKELVELPDSEAVQTILDLYLPSKLAYPDSIWRQNILDYTFSTPPCPEDGWQKNLYELIKDQQALDNETTVSNLLKWIDDHVTIDKDIVYTYFSGSIDPLDYLNMHNIPASGRTILLASSLKLLQVPIRWKGYLEYYSEGKFIPVEEQKDKKNKPDFKQRDITVSVTIDGNKVKASPYENFLLAEMGDKGTIDDTYFDNKDQKLDCVLTFPQDKDVDYYLEGMTRNDNGDAQILIQSVKAGKDKYKIDLNTPKNYFDATANWSSKTRKDIVQYARKWGTGDGCKLIFIRASETSEPQQRMLDEILGKTRDFQAKNCDIIVYTENRSNDDIKNTQGIQLKSGLPVLTDKLNLMSYPAVFLVSPDQQILFSSRGYQMGMGSLLLKKIK